MFYRTVDNHVQDYMVSQPETQLTFSHTAAKTSNLSLKESTTDITQEPSWLQRVHRPQTNFGPV